MTRILITHAYTPANLGDGAILQAMLSEAKRVFGDDVQVEVSAADPEAFSEMLGIKTTGRLVPWKPLGSRGARLRWLLRSFPLVCLLLFGTAGGRRRLEWLAKRPFIGAETRNVLLAFLRADIVLPAGGGYLADHYRRQFPFWHLEYRCARAAGIPLVFFSQSFGPAEHPVSRFFLKRAIAMSAMFIARDERSRTRLRKLGIPEEKIAVAPDVALLVLGTAHEPPSPAAAPTLGLSLMKWANYSTDGQSQHTAYLDAVEGALSDLLANDAVMRLDIVSTNAALGLNLMDDVAVAADMARRLAARGLEERFSVLPWTPDARAFASNVSRCELFLATRMHSAVLALSAGVPVVGIAYEEKMHGLLETFGLGEYVADIEHLDGFAELLARAWANRDEMRAQVAARLPEVQERASTAMELCSRVVA